MIDDTRPPLDARGSAAESPGKCAGKSADTRPPRDPAALDPRIEAALEGHHPLPGPVAHPMYRAARYIQGSLETWGVMMKSWKDSSAGHGARQIALHSRAGDVRVEACVDEQAAVVNLQVEAGFSSAALEVVVSDVSTPAGFEDLRAHMGRLPQAAAQLRAMLGGAP